MTFYTSFIPIAILVICLIMTGALLTIASADASVLRTENRAHLKEIEDLRMQIKLLQMALGGEKDDEPTTTVQNTPPTIQQHTLPNLGGQTVFKTRSFAAQLKNPCTLTGFWIDTQGVHHSVYGAKYRPDGTVEFTDGYILSVKDAQELRQHGWV